MRQREREVLGDELLDVGALDVLGLLDLDNAKDLCLCQQPGLHLAIKSGRSSYVNRPEAGTVAGSHVGVESLNGSGPRGLTVLLVHVVGTRPRVVADPDAEVLDLQRVLLGDLAKNQHSVHGFPHTPAVRTTLTLTISPVAFLTLRRPRRKYQKRDLATTSFGAKMRMR